MNAPDPHPAEMKLRPHNAVTAALPAEQLPSCLTALADAGVDTAAVDVLIGPEGAEILDRDGTHHGLRAKIVRRLQLLGSSENDLRSYSSALQSGRAVLAVPAVDQDRADIVGRILSACRGEHLLYFRATAVEYL